MCSIDRKCVCGGYTIPLSTRCVRQALQVCATLATIATSTTSLPSFQKNNLDNIPSQPSPHQKDLRLFNPHCHQRFFEFFWFYYPHQASHTHTHIPEHHTGFTPSYSTPNVLRKRETLKRTIYLFVLLKCKRETQ